MSMIPDEYMDLLNRPVTVALGTIMPDGTIQMTPVWCSYDGQHVIVNATAKRQKHKNMLERPRVTLLAIDPDDPFRYLEIRGVVEEIIADEDGESMNQLSLLYTGKPKRYGIEAPAREVDERLLYKIRPDHVNAR